jgi:chlorobactene glucosyltransferase
MIYQLVITIALALLLVNLILNLRELRRPSVTAKVLQPAPLISVLIPARNEENNIRKCIESLQRQDYPNFEILVMDDNSDDDTNAIVSAMAARDSRIRLFQGDPLPDDWAGKPFACQQLARKARGAYLLFVDADTTHAPHMLRSVLDLAIEKNTGMLSGFNHQIADTFVQKVTMPVFYFIILGWAPLWLIQRSRKLMPSVAIGQFLFFTRDAYWKMGGHQAVKNRIVEDIWLGVEVTRHGGKHLAADLSNEVSCHMYHNTREIWEGLGKSIYAVVAISPLFIVGLVIIATVLYLAPFYYFVWGLLTGNGTILWDILVILQIAIMLFMRWLVDSRFREPPVSMWFQFFGLGFYVVDVIHAGWRYLTGAPVTWKERSYEKDLEAEESAPPHNIR